MLGSGVLETGSGAGRGAFRSAGGPEIANLHPYRTCPVQSFGHAGSNLEKSWTTSDALEGFGAGVGAGSKPVRSR